MSQNVSFSTQFFKSENLDFWHENHLVGWLTFYKIGRLEFYSFCHEWDIYCKFKHYEKKDFFFLFAKIREQISSSKRSETLQHNGVHCQRKYLCYIELLISTDKNQFLVTFSVTFSKWSHWNHSQHFNSTSDNFFFLFPAVVWIKSSTVYENPPKMSHLNFNKKMRLFLVFFIHYESS